MNNVKVKSDQLNKNGLKYINKIKKKNNCELVLRKQVLFKSSLVFAKSLTRSLSLKTLNPKTQPQTNQQWQNSRSQSTALRDSGMLRFTTLTSGLLTW